MHVHVVCLQPFFQDTGYGIDDLNRKDTLLRVIPTMTKMQSYMFAMVPTYILTIVLAYLAGREEEGRTTLMKPRAFGL